MILNNDICRVYTDFPKTGHICRVCEQGGNIVCEQGSNMESVNSVAIYRVCEQGGNIVCEQGGNVVCVNRMAI